MRNQQLWVKIAQMSSRYLAAGDRPRNQIKARLFCSKIMICLEHGPGQKSWDNTNTHCLKVKDQHTQLHSWGDIGYNDDLGENRNITERVQSSSIHYPYPCFHVHVCVEWWCGQDIVTLGVMAESTLQYPANINMIKHEPRQTQNIMNIKWI